jgi:thiamine kinase-like enzyme
MDSALAEGLSWRPDHTAVCHNDLNPWNLIETPKGRWVTLDWEWVGLNDPLFDLVVLHQGAGFSEAELLPMASAYLERPPQAGRLEDCLTAFWLREYGWANAEIAAGSTRQEIRDQRTLAEAKLAGLARR